MTAREKANKKIRNRDNSTKAILKGLKAGHSFAKRMKKKQEQAKRKSKKKGRLDPKDLMTRAEQDLEQSVQLLLDGDNDRRSAAYEAWGQAKKANPVALSKQLSAVQQKTKLEEVRKLCEVLIKDLPMPKEKK